MVDVVEPPEVHPGNVGVVGAGYVGLTTGICFAELGYRVRVLEINKERVESLQAGEVPIYELGLEDLLRKHLASGTITFTSEITDAIPQSDFVFLCVPTPPAADGSADTSYLRQASAEIGPHLLGDAVVINKSTVPVGSTEIVFDQLGRTDVHVASNPEFLREGTAINDFMNPDRVVIGCADLAIAERVAGLYGQLNAEMVLTDPASAELIKYASNAYLATRLSFINAVAEVCEVLGGDVTQVARAIGLDSRIGPHFLKPGPGWGGSCFPKDTTALATMAETGGFEFKFLRAVIDSNEQQFDRVATKALSMLADPLTEKVAVWGLAFKAGTDDTRQSPAIEIIERITGQGVSVVAYDPKATVAIDGMTQVESALEAATGAHVLLILTEWPEFAGADPAAVANAMAGARVLDTRNIVDRDVWSDAGFMVRSIGRPSRAPAPPSRPFSTGSRTSLDPTTAAEQPVR